MLIKKTLRNDKPLNFAQQWGHFSTVCLNDHNLNEIQARFVWLLLYWQGWSLGRVIIEMYDLDNNLHEKHQPMYDAHASKIWIAIFPSHLHVELIKNIRLYGYIIEVLLV